MNEASLPLTALSEAQRAKALERYTIIRPALEKEVSQAQVARTHQLPPSTVQLWIKRYHEKGLASPLLHPRLPSWVIERSFIPLLIECLMMRV
jgi:transposase-like protein